MPVFATAFIIITFSSIAVPGTNGFIGEFLVLLGTFKSSLHLAFGVFAATGVILGAAYMLWMVQKVFFGALAHRENVGLTDMNKRELVTVLPFLVLVLVMGLRPQPFLDRLEPSTNRFIARSGLAVPGSARAADETLRVKTLALPAAEGATPTVAKAALEASVRDASHTAARQARAAALPSPRHLP